MSAGWTCSLPDRDNDHQTLDITCTAYSTKIMLCATYLLAAWVCACGACVSGLELFYSKGPGRARQIHQRTPVEQRLMLMSLQRQATHLSCCGASTAGSAVVLQNLQHTSNCPPCTSLWTLQLMATSTLKKKSKVDKKLERKLASILSCYPAILPVLRTRNCLRSQPAGRFVH